MKNEIENIEKKNNNRLSFILRDWLHKSLSIKYNTSAKLIQDKFRMSILKKNNEIKKRKSLVIEKRKSNVFNIMSKAKQFRALNTISDSIKKLAGEKVFEKILKKKPKKKVRFLDNIKIVSLRRSKKDNLKVRKYLFRWKKKCK